MHRSIPISTQDLEHLVEFAHNSNDWRAALVILFGRFRYDPRVWSHVLIERCGIDFAAMLNDDTWSSGQRRLLTVAASLFSWEAFPYSLVEFAHGLDEEAFSLAMTALCIHRGTDPTDIPWSSWLQVLVATAAEKVEDESNLRTS